MELKTYLIGFDDGEDEGFPLDKARLEHIGAQTIDCYECGKTGIPLYQFWDGDDDPLCAECLLSWWHKSLPNDDDWPQLSMCRITSYYATHD